MKYIASVSFGKDSLAMLLYILEKNLPLDEVLFYDTGMEFQAIYNLRDKTVPILRERSRFYRTTSRKTFSVRYVRKRSVLKAKRASPRVWLVRRGVPLGYDCQN